MTDQVETTDAQTDAQPLTVRQRIFVGALLLLGLLLSYLIMRWIDPSASSMHLGSMGIHASGGKIAVLG